MVFEWDERKADRNERLHGVRFNDAVGVFADPHAIEFVDEAHSTESEIRYGIIGLATSGMVYVCLRSGRQIERGSFMPGMPRPGWWRNMKNKGKEASLSSRKIVEPEFAVRRDSIRM